MNCFAPLMTGTCTCPQLKATTTSTCDPVNWNALYALHEMHSMIPYVVLYPGEPRALSSGEPIMLHAGEPSNNAKQCEPVCLRNSNRLDDNDSCHHVASDITEDASVMLQPYLDYTYLDFISADEYNLNVVTDKMDALHNHLDNDELFGLQLRMLPTGLAIHMDSIENITLEMNSQIVQNNDVDGLSGTCIFQMTPSQSNDSDLMDWYISSIDLGHQSRGWNCNLDGPSQVGKMKKMEMHMLYVSHVFQVKCQIIMMKMMMILVGFDSMTWQDIMDFFTKIRGKRQDVCIEIAILLSILYSSTWNGLNQELTGMNNNRLGTTVG